MPALTAPPTVSVFSSTNKISNAKIRKYTSASEKGISVYEEIATLTPGLASTPSPSLNDAPTSLGGLSKRQRGKLKESNPIPFVSPSAFAVPRVKRRRAAPKIDLTNKMVFEDGITVIEPEFPPDSDASSDETTLTPPPPSAKASPQREAATPEDLEYGAGFASYYLIDDDADDGKKKAVKAAPAVKAPKPTKPQEASRHPPSQHVQAPQHPQPPHHQSRAPQHRSSVNRVPSGLPPPQPPPTINIIHDIQSNPNPSKPASVDEMVAKLEKLSHALVKFGAVPPPARDTATLASRNDSTANATSVNSAHSPADDQGDESVSGLLAMFDDDEGDESDDSSSSGKAVDPHMPTGPPDDSLTYGVQFIMNALTTWAKQRINAHYEQQWHHYNQMVHQQQQFPQQKKARGRPKKDELDHRPPTLYPPPPPTQVNAELTKTPEGEAVQAFQDVLDCGALRKNTSLPTALAQALGTLYVQIDHLINNSAREEQRWECLSYQAQIKAHNIKVQRWKEQVAKMQAEMAKQQELAHQQMMVQMGVPQHLQHRGVMTQEQALRHRDMSLELKRGEQQATQQPHLSHYLTTPMDLDTQKSNTVAVPSSSTSPTNGGAANASLPLGRPPSRQDSNPTVQSSSSRIRDAMSRVTMYHDGKPANVAPEHLKSLSMRSGQGMKFSFDHGEAARKLFGDQAFPSNTDYGSSIPRRGPMAKNIEQPGLTNGINLRTPTPVLGSNAPPLNGVAETIETRKGKIAEAAINGTSVNINGSKDAAVINGHTSENHKDPVPTATPVKSPTYTHKRKLSESVNGSAPASPAQPKRSGKTIRLGKTRRSAASETPATAEASGPSAAIVVDE